MQKRKTSQIRTPKLAAPGFTRNTLLFIKKAGRQKRTDWLDRNREEYVAEVVEPLQAIARSLKKELAGEAVGYHFPQKGIGRLKRTASSAAEYGGPFRDYITYQARRPNPSRFEHNPGFFLLVYPEDGEGDEVLFAGGLYMPSSSQLKAIRQAIATNAAPFEKLFKSQAFASRFPKGFSDERKSKRPPRGFDPNHPKIEWLKNQGYFVWRSYRKKEYVSPHFGEILVKDARQILRLNTLLEQAISGRWVSEEKTKKTRKPAILSALDELKTPARREMDF